MNTTLRSRIAGLIRRAPLVPPAAEGDVATCGKCGETIALLDGTWTCIANDCYLYGETNCPADLTGPYTPHQPVTSGDIEEAIGNIEEAIERDCADYDARHAAAARPPWDATAPAAYPNPGPGSLAAYHAAEDLRRQALAETTLDMPVSRIRPYAPETEPEPEPQPVSYPPLSLKADYRDLPTFQAVVRGACRVGLRGIGIRHGGNPPALPDFRVAEQMTAATMPGGVIL